MRKVIGIGETILDIILKDNQPTKAVAGGSVFNAMVSLARLGTEVAFLSELGNDKVGRLIMEFMEENNLSTHHLNIYGDGKTPLSMAFLDSDMNAHYEFYTNYPSNRLDVVWPRIEEDDIVIIASYFALNPVLRKPLTELLEYAKERKAIIYYDLNFRESHKHEVVKLMPFLLENLEYADIVKGSVEDFKNLYQLTDAYQLYKDKLSFYCPTFIYTQGEKEVKVITPTVQESYPVTPIQQPISTIGAGDTFNAGVLWALLHYNITRADLATLTPEQWREIVTCSTQLASHVINSYDNYITTPFAKQFLESYNR